MSDPHGRAGSAVGLLAWLSLTWQRTCRTTWSASAATCTRSPSSACACRRTQERVLAALDGLPLEISTGDSLTSVTAVLRGGVARRALRAAPRRHGRAARHRARRRAVRGRRATRCTPAATTCTPRCSSAPRRCSVAQRESLPGDVVFMFQPGEEGQDGARHMVTRGRARRRRPPGRRCLRDPRHVLAAAGRLLRQPGRHDPVRRRDPEGHRAGRGRPRLGAAPRQGPDPGSLRDGQRAADLRHATLRHLRPGGHHGRLVPRRHAVQRDPRRRDVRGDRAVVLPARRTSGSWPRSPPSAPRSARRTGSRSTPSIEDLYPVTVNTAAQVDVARARSSPSTTARIGGSRCPTRCPARRTSPGCSTRCPA